MTQFLDSATWMIDNLQRILYQYIFNSLDSYKNGNNEISKFQPVQYAVAY